MHAVGATARFSSRVTLDVDSYGVASRDFLLGLDIIPPDSAAAWLELVDQALAACRVAFDAAPLKNLRLHGDCHLAHPLDRARPHFVALDYAVNGPAIQDLWMLLRATAPAMSGQLHRRSRGLRSVIDSTGAGPPDRALRTLRMIHHSAWIARAADPCPIAFPCSQPGDWSDHASAFASTGGDGRPPLGSPPESGVGAIHHTR